MKQNISLQELIAINNPSKAKALVIKYGYKPARNYNDLIYKLFQLTREYREDALKDLVDIHPHKDLIINYAMPIVSEKKLNFEGDNMCSSCKEKQKEYINFEGDVASNTTTPNINSDWKKMLPTIVISSVATVLLIDLIKKLG
jgi:hypothetical protein